MIALAGLPFSRIVRVPRVLVTVLAWSAFAILVAVVERRHAGSHGADLVLPEIFGNIVVPFLVFALVGAVAASTSLRVALRPLTALGANGSRAAFATVFVVAMISAALCAALGAGLVPLAGSPAPIRSDVLASAWVSALGGASYACFFSLGATFGRRGTGRIVFLVVDWLVGSTEGLELLTPHAHLRNLLGGAPIAHVSQTVSTIVLAAIAVLCAAITARRAR